MNVDRIRQSLADLDSPEAAPRLNAQVRLREEHVEMLGYLLGLLKTQWEERRSPVGEEQRGSKWPLPTEVLKAEKARLEARIQELEVRLREAVQRRCPDRQCPNCIRRRRWQLAWGIDWDPCGYCGAEAGEPCMDMRGGDRTRTPTRRPHRERLNSSGRRAPRSPLLDSP